MLSTTILIIEDNPTNLDLMAYLLTAFGYDLLFARDGEEGLAAARQHVPDLIICDIQLPKLSGFEVSRLLKDDLRLNQIPLLAVTALAMVGDRDKVLSAGFDGYLTKPINPANFVSDVEGFLPSEKRNAIVSAHDHEGSTVQSQQRDQRQQKILVVDNSPANIDLATSLFEPFGYEITAASGLSEALQRLNEKLPDLILSDVCMSDGTGYQLVELLKQNERFKTIPVVLITSTLSTERDRRRGLALGASEFLFRPIEPSSLLAKIEAVLERETDKN
jgi:two-component system cell cycle response regulator